MKRARIEYLGDVLSVTIGDGDNAITADGRTIPAGQFTWLSPIENPGTIFALGLNYADHGSSHVDLDGSSFLGNRESRSHYRW